MAITLRNITKDNWEDCIDLKVSDAQKGFIASNVYSLAQVQFLEDFEALAIYADERMVGFTMFGVDEDDGNYWNYRIMIDENFQGKGYGTAALNEIIRRLGTNPKSNKVYLGYQPENIGAEKLYYSVGFQEAGMAPWGEKLAVYYLDK